MENGPNTRNKNTTNCNKQHQPISFKDPNHFHSVNQISFDRSKIVPLGCSRLVFISTVNNFLLSSQKNERPTPPSLQPMAFNNPNPTRISHNKQSNRRLDPAEAPHPIFFLNHDLVCLVSNQFDVDLFLRPPQFLCINLT